MPSGKWKPLGTFRAAPVGPEPEGLEQSLRAGEYRATEPRYRDLEIGGWRFPLEEIP